MDYRPLALAFLFRVFSPTVLELSALATLGLFLSFHMAICLCICIFAQATSYDCNSPFSTLHPLLISWLTPTYPSTSLRKLSLHCLAVWFLFAVHCSCWIFFTLISHARSPFSGAMPLAFWDLGQLMEEKDQFGSQKLGRFYCHKVWPRVLGEKEQTFRTWS